MLVLYGEPIISYINVATLCDYKIYTCSLRLKQNYCWYVLSSRGYHTIITIMYVLYQFVEGVLYFDLILSLFSYENYFFGVKGCAVKMQTNEFQVYFHLDTYILLRHTSSIDGSVQFYIELLIYITVAQEYGTMCTVNYVNCRGLS